jgi:sugar lactone lactonase YvrE
LTVGDVKVLADGLHFGEGPRWHDGQLWLSDFYDHAVKTVDLDGKVETVVEVDGQPSGLGWLPDGRMLIVSMLDRRLLRRERDGSLVEHADLSGVATFHTNDMVVDGKGRAYVGNFGFNLFEFLHEHSVAEALGEPGPTRAKLARVDPDGSVHVAAEDLKFPNGTVVTPDGRTLIVAETFGLRLTAFDIDSDGSLHNRRLWADLGGRPPDGICLDADTNVWVANPLEPVCFLVAEDGGVVAEVETDQPCFACMLGGPERRHLFMLTAASSDPGVAAEQRTGHVLVTEVTTPGVGWP